MVDPASWEFQDVGTGRGPARVRRYLPAFACAAGLAVAAGAIATLVAYSLDPARVGALWPRFHPWMPNAVLMTACNGLALCIFSQREARARWVGRALALISCLVGLLTLAEYGLRVDLGIDRLLVSTSVEILPGAPGRPSPHTSLALVLNALSMAMLDGRWPRRRPVSDLLAFLSALLPGLAMLGFFYSRASHVAAPQDVFFTGIGPIAALCVLVLDAGVIAARPLGPSAQLLTSAGPGGLAIRRLLPVVLLLPMLGLAFVLGVRHQVFAWPTGVALTALCAVALSGAVAVRVSFRLNAAARALQRALSEAMQWKYFFEHASFGAVVLTRDGSVLVANPAMAALTRTKSEALVGRKVWELFTSTGDARQRLTTTHPHGPVTFDCELLRADGSTLSVVVDATEVRDAKNAVLYRALYVQDITERKRSEEVRTRLASLVDASEDAIIAQSLTGEVLHWNVGAERLYGYLAEERVGRSMLELVPPELHAEYLRRLGELRQGRRVQLHESERQAKDGRRFPVSVTLSPVFDEAGRVVGAASICRDITERKQAEQALKRAHESEQRLRRELELIAAASLSVSEAAALLPSRGRDHVLETLAQQARALTGAEHAAVALGSEARGFERWAFGDMPPAQVELLRQLAPILQDHRDVLRTEDLHSVESHHSAEVPVRSLRGVPIRYQGHPAGGLYLTNRVGAEDFSQEDERVLRTLAERMGPLIELSRIYEQEARQRAWLLAVLDQLPEGVLILDERGDVALENRATASLAGQGARTPLKLRVDLCTPSGEPIPLRERPLWRALTRGESVRGLELVARDNEGRLTPVLVSATPVQTAHGPVGAVGTFQDIRTLKELERLREEWTSVIAHELKQPVATIKLAAELLPRLHQGGLLPIERSTLDRIRQASKRLSRMIDDLQDASRIEARRLSVDRRAVNIRELIGRVAEQLPESMPIRVAAPSDALAWADPDRIQQVLENLLGNVAKYGEPGAEVRIDVLRRGPALEVVVTNRGAGIPPDQLPILFDRFARARPARQGHKPGLGLGLYIVRGLVEAHGGKVWVESTPGETTSFHFTLPAMPSLVRDEGLEPDAPSPG